MESFNGSLTSPQKKGNHKQHNGSVAKFVSHSKRVLDIATKYGWLPGARYTNLRDVKTFDTLGFLDIHWKNYDFKKHLEAAKATRPLLTVAKDIEKASDLAEILDQAHALAQFCKKVIIVPKTPEIDPDFFESLSSEFLLGFSVPTRYGQTPVSPERFRRPVHLLGGRPDVQRHLAEMMPVVSLDCNRFTLDAAFGDYFDGETFRPHPKGGYKRCIEDSIRNINNLWKSYSVPKVVKDVEAKRADQNCTCSVWRYRRGNSNCNCPPVHQRPKRFTLEDV